MQKNNKLFLTAAVSAVILFGGIISSSNVQAYTYNNQNTSESSIKQDSTDLVLNNSTVSYTGNTTLSPNKVITGDKRIIGSSFSIDWESVNEKEEYGTKGGADEESGTETFASTQTGVAQANEWLKENEYNNISSRDPFAWDAKNNQVIVYDDHGRGMGAGGDVTWEGNWSLSDSTKTSNITYEPSSITLKNSSTLNTNSNVSLETKVSTTLSETSKLNVGGNFTTPIVSIQSSNLNVNGNASIASGGLKTTGTSKVDVSNGTLTVGSGAVNIAKGGILKAKVLRAAATGTETSVIGSSTNIQGTLTVAGQVKGVTAGTASTDAVNKGQLDSAVNTLTTKIGQGGKTYTAGSDIDISSANAISVKKAGLIASGNTGIVTGGTVYSTTNALNTQIKTTSQEVAKISDKVSSYGKTITSISSSVTSAISNMKNNQANFVDTSLSNISTDGKDVIKQVVRDVLAANTASTASTTASAKANLLKASFMAAPMRAPASLSAGDHVTISGNTISVDADGTVASGDTGLVTGGTVYNAIKDTADKSYVDEGLAKKADISYVDQGLSQKVNVSDFTPVKQQVETNTSDISALKTGKADADGSNINVGSFTTKLNTGKVEKGNTGLVSGGTVYDSLQAKADVGYVNTMGMALDSEIKGTAQGLHNEIQDMGNRLTKDINRVGAGSAALAALHPQDFNPDDKWDFAVGYGHYKNANASAVGAFYRPNAGTTVSLASTVGNGDPQISAGVSFKIGMGKNVEKVMVNKDDYDKLNRKVESQAVENKEMKEAMNAQNEKIQELEEMVRRLAVK